jgi:sugar O-acyltransferase (sialic acid O-acetyltransferase NeuD family)
VSKGVLLIGAGGHARSCIDVIESAGLRVFGLIDRDPTMVGGDVLGYPMLGSDCELLKLAKDSSGALITVGQIGRPKIRVSLYEKLTSCGVVPLSVSANTARVSRHASVGHGSIVMHQALVNAGARVGVNCIINTGAIVEHDVEIGDHCHIAIGAVIGGGVRIGAGSFVGAGAIISHGVSIGSNSIIGAGCVVMSDCPAETFMKRSA